MTRTLAALILAATPALAQVATLTGPVTHVRDADTIVVGGVPVRLQGVAAPERGEPRYAEGLAFVESWILGREVRCELDGTRTRDRVVGVCYLAGSDIGATVVNMGLARDCPAFSGGRYAVYEGPASLALPLPGYCEP